MGQVVLKAKKRSNLGSAEAGRIRRSGRIPGVLYGRSGKAESIDLDAKEFIDGIKGISESTIVKVDLDGRSLEAFVKDTQRNILDGNILHVDFYEVESGVSLRARVSISLKGNPVGVREGGVLEFPLHEIEVECLPKDLPERIELDVSNNSNQNRSNEYINIVSEVEQINISATESSNYTNLGIDEENNINNISKEEMAEIRSFLETIYGIDKENIYLNNRTGN